MASGWFDNFRRLLGWYSSRGTLGADVDEAATFRAWKRPTASTTIRYTLADTAKRPTRFVAEERGTR